MENLRILNSRGKKDLAGLISGQFGLDFEFDYEVFMNSKNRIFILSRDISKLDTGELRINSLGMYFGELNKGEVRLSIEGSQIIGKQAMKNVLELDEGQATKWMWGEDFELDTDLSGFVIIKNNSDFLGCGKVSGRKLYNYVPKERRVTTTF